jgi:succinate-acetate transporter protein
MATQTPQSSAADRPTRASEHAPAVAAPGADIADPGPLGLAGFAMTTFVLSCFNAKLIDSSLESVVLPLALLYGGIAQFAAGMWEFKKGNTFGALAFTSYGAFWLSFAAYVKFIAGGLPPETAHQATGLFLLAWTIFTLYMTICTFRLNGALVAVFVLLSLTFIALTFGQFNSNDSLIKIGGWLGLVTAAAAWYTSFAGVSASVFKRSVVPVWPRA